MAKETCKHCGKEIGFTSQVKLIDGAFICRDCYKLAGSFRRRNRVERMTINGGY